ncbi:GNAT family N-acetyltransferase [Pelagibius sp.]|uniref:GNAT family N-acetyltransferase n=1 Tax=Pelagibius sp. TaxID=1931238 RepID=UPI002635FE03|nr:GNAT family N-acetyltransferase [Pelagibius sp.]
MTRSTARIRLARREDMPAIEAMHFLSVQALNTRDYTADQIEAFISHLGTYDPSLIDDETYFVAEEEGRIVASGGWSLRTPQFDKGVEDAGNGPGKDPGSDPGSGQGMGLSPNSAKIRSIFVHPQHTRRGLATRLVQLSEEQAVMAGCRILELWATLTGVPLYCALGYEEVGRIAFAAPDVQPLLSVHMAKLISTGASRSGLSGASAA